MYARSILVSVATVTSILCGLISRRHACLLNEFRPRTVIHAAIKEVIFKRTYLLFLGDDCVDVDGAADEARL